MRLRNASAQLCRSRLRPARRDGEDDSFRSCSTQQSRQMTASQASRAIVRDLVTIEDSSQTTLASKSRDAGPLDIVETFLKWQKPAPQRTQVTTKQALAVNNAARQVKNPVKQLRTICKLEDRIERHERKLQHHWEFLHNIRKVSAAHNAAARPERPVEVPGDIHAWNRELVDDQIRTLRQRLQEEERFEVGSQYEREPKTDLQFRRLVDMVNKLVDDLMWTAHVADNPEETPEELQRTLERYNPHWKAISDYRNGGLPRYQPPGVNQQSTVSARQALNRNFRDFFNTWNDHPPTARVGHICSNLLACYLPPGIHNYNALIFGFTTVGRHDLGQVVVDSLLEQSRLRPSVQTFPVLLLHYQAKGDVVGFYNILRRISGATNNGLLLGRRGQDDNNGQLYERSYRPAGSRSVWRVPSITQHWAVNIPELSEDLSNAVMSGLLVFDRNKDAAKVFLMTMWATGSVNHVTLQALIRKCLHNLDPSAASVLIKGLAGLSQHSAEMLLSDSVPPRLSEQLQDLLSLIIAAGPWEDDAVLARSIDPTCNENVAGSCRAFSVALHISQLVSYMARVEKTLRIIRTTLRAYRANSARAVDVAIKQLDALDKHYTLLEVQRDVTGTLGTLKTDLQIFAAQQDSWPYAGFFHQVRRKIRHTFPATEQPCIHTAAAAEALMRHQAANQKDDTDDVTTLDRAVEFELAISAHFASVAEWYLERANGSRLTWPEYARQQNRRRKNRRQFKLAASKKVDAASLLPKPPATLADMPRDALVVAS